jgi:hypothetical protein
MPPEVVSGTRGTENIQTAKKVVDMRSTIALLDPKETPFMSFLMIAKRNKRVVTNPRFDWLEDDLLPRWDAVNNGAGYADNAASIVVDNGIYFTPGDQVKVPRSGEVMLVTAVNDGTNTLTVKRGYGVTTALALVDNDALLIIGNANEEGSGARAVKSTKEQNKYNYTQIFKTPFAVTNTQQATKMYGGKDLSYQQAKGGVQHKIDIARSFVFGERYMDTGSDGQPRRATGGLLSFLTENNYDAGGALTQSEFDNNVSEVVFKHGSKEKIVLCSARFLSVVNGWAQGALRINQEAKKFGLEIFEYVTPFGKYQLMNEQRILEGSVYGGYGIVIDPEQVSYNPLEGRDTKLETNIQANDADQRKDQYITEAGLEVRLPKTHAVITGVTS